MLSRTASQLYWLSRYMERAESMARILDVAFTVSLQPSANKRLDWMAPMTITNTLENYRGAYGSNIQGDQVLEFLVLDSNNPSSIWSSLRSARENAHAVRGKIPAELWESINATWLEMRAHTPDTLRQMGVNNFFEWIKERSHIFRGVIYSTMRRDDTFRFLRLGTYIERADNTARILDVKYHLLLPSVSAAGSAADYYQWSALLNSVSGLVAYRSIYRDVITPRNVADLLILREDMPRSLHTCLAEIHSILPSIEGSAGSEAKRRAAELYAGLRWGDIDQIFEHGLHPYLEQFLGSINELAVCIHRAYWEAT